MPKNKAKPVKRLKEPSATNASEQTLNVSHHTRAEVATEQQFKNEEADPDAIKVLLTGFGVSRILIKQKLMPCGPVNGHKGSVL